MPATRPTCSWKSAPAPAATKPPCSPATCSACTPATPRRSAGRWRRWRPTRARSAATVAIMPGMDDIAEIDIAPGDIKTGTFRASGAGGQHVNKTDSAIRITHLPTGIVVECQDERSQHKNRSRALSLLRARLLEAEQQKQAAQQAESRRLQVGSG